MKSIKYLFPLILYLFIPLILYPGYVVCEQKDVNALFQEAEKLFHAGEFYTALERYKELLSDDPSFIDAYGGVIRCSNSLGDPQGALMFMEALFLEYPKRGEVSYGLGYSMYNLEKYDEALKYFKKAIELNRNIAAAWNNCAVIYHYIIKDFRKAKHYYETALEISLRREDDRVYKIANENIKNLPKPMELKPYTETLTFEDFINRFISYADSRRSKELSELILGQKENSKRAMEWLLDNAIRAHVDGNPQNEKKLIILADILQDEYYISYKDSKLFETLQEYKNKSGIEKVKIVEGERLLEAGFKKEKDGKYIEALQDYNAALENFTAAEDKRRQGFALLYLGDLHTKQKKYSLAYDTYSKGLSIFIETGDMERKAYTLSTLGIICFKMGEHSKAIDYLNRSLKTYGFLHNQEALAKVQHNLDMIIEKGQGFPLD